MNRVYFEIKVCPKFNRYMLSLYAIRHEGINWTNSVHDNWVAAFKSVGYKTYEYDHKNQMHSLSEEEYTWFLLRWS